MRGPHIDIVLTEEQDRELKLRAKEKGLCKTDYARMKLFQTDIGNPYAADDAVEGDGFITLKEFADSVHISLSSARRLCSEKKIAYYKIGKAIRLKRDQIENFYHPEEYEDEYDSSVYMDTMQASEYMAVTRTTILRWINAGVLKATFLGNKYIVAREELDSLILSNKKISMDK